MFFQNLNQMMTPGVDITLSIRKQGDQLIVATLPKANGLKDEAQNLITPFTVSGSIEELDAGFIQALTQPIQLATGLLSNMKQFEEQASKAASSSKGGKQQEIKGNKEMSEKREKYDKLMKRVEEFEAEGNIDNAIICCMQAKAHATEDDLKNVQMKLLELKSKQSGGLFDNPPVDHAGASFMAQSSSPAQSSPYNPTPVQPFVAAPTAQSPSTSLF